MRPEMLRDTSRPSRATTSAISKVPSTMRQVIALTLSLIWVSGSEVRTTASTW